MSTTGPHQAINRCAFRVWAEWRLGKREFTKYKMSSPMYMRKVQAKSFTNAANFYPDMTEGYKNLSLGEWLQEGGYTADEPEIWQALRHFYDPTKPQRPWLADPHAGLYATAWYWGTKKYGDPQMDAITWAIEGPAKNGQPANEYSWEKARGYMEAAWGETKSADEKDRLFGAGWRGVGETMHLVADMTVPAHVRNDGHAGKLPVGSLGPDPLETRTTDERVMEVFWSCVQGRMEAYPAVRDRTGADVYEGIEQAKDPRELMTRVATWTNKNFFSQDTVAGVLTVAKTPKLKTVYVSAVNGTDYSSPRLEDCVPDTDYGESEVETLYKRTVKMGYGTPREVYVARLAWTTEWWGLGKTALRGGGYVLDNDVIESQCHALLPTAIFANVQTIDMAMPRVEVEIENVDVGKRTFEGHVKHKPGGMYTKELRYSLPAYEGDWLRFAVVKLDSNVLGSADCTMTIKEGKIEGKIKEGKELGGRKLTLGVDVGGFMVESEPFKMGAEDLVLKTWNEKSGGTLIESFTYYDKPWSMPKNWHAGVLKAGWTPSTTYNILENPIWVMSSIAPGRHGNKVIHGNYRRCYEKGGELACEATYTYGNLNGPVRLYRPSWDAPTIKGGLYLDGAYRNNAPDGVWHMRDWKGRVEIIETWKEGEHISLERVKNEDK